MNIILAGNESAGARVLQEIVKTKHSVKAVVASESKSGLALIKRAQSMGIPIWPGSVVKDSSSIGAIKSLRTDLLLNVHAQFIICEDVLNAPKYGCFNLHPGPLPEYAGSNPVSWAIYNGEKHHGITIHKMVPKVDAGPIVLKEYFKIESEETGISLMSKCVMKGVPLVREFIEIAERGLKHIPFESQDLTKRRFYSKNDIPNHGRMCWGKSCEDVSRFVRACNFLPYPSPWGRPKVKYNNMIMEIIDAECTGMTSQGKPGTLHMDGNDFFLVSTKDNMIRIKTKSKGTFSAET